MVGFDELQTFIEAGRAALGDPTADIRLTSSELHTRSGHDPEAVLKELGIRTGAGEVEQQPWRRIAPSASVAPTTPIRTTLRWRSQAVATASW